MNRRRHGLGSESGQSLVEFALVVPLLLILIVGIMEFGRAWYMSQAINYAARQGARIAAVISGENNGSPAGAPTVDSVYRVVQRALAAGNIDPATATMDAPGYMGGTDTPVTVNVSVPYQFAIFAPVMRLAGQSQAASITLRSSAVMRNE